MFQQTLAIARNTFFESIRQPIVLVLLIAATLLLIVANLTSTFTMSDDQKMLIDVGMATVFLFGALLAAFIASNVLTREIENRTVLTVVSKPVARTVFIIGKFLGVAGAIIVASLYMCFVFMLVDHHGVMQTVRTPFHVPVIVFGVTAAFLTLVVSVWCNYFYGRVFASTMICTATPLAAIAYLMALLFKPDFALADFTKEFDVNLWKALLALVMANLVLTGVAIAVSTRLNQVMTIVVTIGLFMGGMLSDWIFGAQMYQPREQQALAAAVTEGDVARVELAQVVQRTRGGLSTGTREELFIANDAFRDLNPDQMAQLQAGEVSPESLGLENPGFGVVWSHLASTGDQALYLLGRIGHTIVPNFQTLWLSDAVTQDHVIPTGYLFRVLLYGAAMVFASLAMAVILFERREVG